MQKETMLAVAASEAAAARAKQTTAIAEQRQRAGLWLRAVTSSGSEVNPQTPDNDDR